MLINYTKVFNAREASSLVCVIFVYLIYSAFGYLFGYRWNDDEKYIRTRMPTHYDTKSNYAGNKLRRNAAELGSWKCTIGCIFFFDNRLWNGMARINIFVRCQRVRKIKNSSVIFHQIKFNKYASIKSECMYLCVWTVTRLVGVVRSRGQSSGFWEYFLSC